LVCVGFIILSTIVSYLLQSDRYKIHLLFQEDRYKDSYGYLLYRCLTKDTEAALGLFRPVDFRTDFFGLVYEGNSRNLLDKQILCFGAQEKYILFFMRDVAGLLGKNEVVFFDIGANVGQHSLFMSRLVKEVHAFEPYPPVLEKFRRLVAINNIGNVHIHPVGLGNENGQLPFSEPPDSDTGTGSFLPKGSPSNKSVSMPLVIGDEWLEEIEARRVDIVKCDIEGYEKPALLGLRRTLERNRPIVVMELNLGSEESFKSIDDLYATFPHSYELLLFCKEDPYTGHYQLCKQGDRLDFKKQERHNIVVYPMEKKQVVMTASRHN
jgi:FkbM family methyltransferase